MHKKIIAFVLCGLLSGSSVCVMAEEASSTPAEPTKAMQIDPTLTNMTMPYPDPDTILPAAPKVPEGGIKNVSSFMEYGKEVDAYVKVAQQYINGATNDANDIIRKRNAAAEEAQKVVNAYNAQVEAANNAK